MSTESNETRATARTAEEIRLDSENQACGCRLTVHRGESPVCDDCPARHGFIRETTNVGVAYNVTAGCEPK